MGTWIARLVLLGIIASGGYTVYDSYRGGFFDLPDFNRTSYAISFKNGLRGIVVDPVVSNPMQGNSKFFRRLARANPDRRYLGLPFNVPPWFEDNWAFCHAPTEAERIAIERDMPDDLKRDLVGARFDALCKIEVEGESLWRGVIYSVPDQ